MIKTLTSGFRARGGRSSPGFIAILGVLVPLLFGCEAAKRSSLQESAPPLATAKLGDSWHASTSLEMRLREPRSVDHWVFDSATVGIRRLLPGGTSASTGGEMLFIEDQLLLVRQINLPVGAELDFVDDLILKHQLVVNLLEAAFPQGPRAVHGSLLVAIDDQGQPIYTETSNTTRVYSPPWTIRARATRTDPETLTYNITFDAQFGGAGNRRARFEIDGRWTKSEAPEALLDDMRLEQWRAYRLRLGTKATGGLTIAAWVAVPDARRYRTLGDARQSVTPRR